MIECNNNFLVKFQKYISLLFTNYSSNISNKIPLYKLINRTGLTLKNNEWINSKVIDLSTMKNDDIFINDFSNGEDFKTNIRTINNLDLVYGSIRPYFKKAGFALDVNYIAGSVYSFNVICKKNYLWILACICSNDFHNYTSSNSQGTKMPIINWDTFCNYNCPYDEKIIHDFNLKVSSLFDKAIIKMKQNRNLSKIKKLLLDKYF